MVYNFIMVLDTKLSQNSIILHVYWPFTVQILQQTPTKGF